MSEEQSLKQKTAKGLFWGGLNSSVRQLLGLLFGVVLGRLLDPADYGMISMLAIFPAITSALQESGFVTALANRERVSDKGYSAVFRLSISFSAVLYILFYSLTPLIVEFYDTPELMSLARFSFLNFFIASFGIAPRALLFRNLKVKENTIISLSSLFLSGVVGIILTANGFAYWGLAIQTTTFVVIGAALNWYFAHWKSSFRINFSLIRKIFGFNNKMLTMQVFIIINQNLFSVLLGKFYTKQEVGDFSQANSWNSKGHTLITGVINGVTQPVLASVASDPQRQATVFHKMLRFTAFISFPAMFGLSLISRESILIVITDKWLASAWIIQLLCIWRAFIPINNLFSLLLVSRGRSPVFMFNSIALNVLQLITACISYPYGITTMIHLFIAINIFWLLVWYCFARREAPLTLFSVLKDIAPYFLLAASLTIAAHYTTSGIINLYPSLAIKVVFVASLYALVLWKIQPVTFKECIQFIKKKKDIMTTPTNYITTWFYKESKEDASFYPQAGKRGDSALIYSIYMQIQVPFFATFRHYHPNDKLLFFSNLDQFPDYLEWLFKELRIETVTLPYLCIPPKGWYGAWRNQLYLYDVLRYVEKRMQADDTLLICDAGCLCMRLLGQLFSDTRKYGSALYDASDRPNLRVGGITLKEMTDIYNDYYGEKEKKEKKKEATKKAEAEKEEAEQ